MGSASVSIVHETSHAAVATWRQVAVMAFRERVTVEAIDACLAATNRLALETPCCVLAIFGERVPVPDSDAMKAAVASLRDSRAVCRARVVPGIGMRASAIRGAIESAQASSGDRRPQEQFVSIQDATAWLAHTMSRDAVWRQQLTTVSGTLLYGSPSFVRHSQIAPYLAGEDVSGSDAPPDLSLKPKRQ